MLNLVQHLTKPKSFQVLKRVQGDRKGIFQSSLFILTRILCYNNNTNGRNVTRSFKEWRKNVENECCPKNS